MSFGRIEKNVVLKASQASAEIDKLINRLGNVTKELKRIEAQSKTISFEKFIPAIKSFEKNFEKINIKSENLENIKLTAQALNRFKMVATELNKKDFSVTFKKMTRGIYSFTNSIGRMDLVDSTIGKIEKLGRGINRLAKASVSLQETDVSFKKLTVGIYAFTKSMNRMELLERTLSKLERLGSAITKLVNASAKMQNMKVSFTSLTQAIYAFTGSILRLKNLDEATIKLERLGLALERIKGNLKGVRFTSVINGVKKLGGGFSNLKSLSFPALDGIMSRLKGISRSINISNIFWGLRGILGLLRRFNDMLKNLARLVYDLTKKYAEYLENINLSTVAYGGLKNSIKELYPFVEKLSRAFGLNESEVMRAVGLFKQMANAMQLTHEQGDLLATGLTKMAYDISSLYNIPFDRALGALQASLVGQTKPIKKSSSFTWKHVSNNLVNVCKNGVKAVINYFKQEMACQCFC